jgi:hypothetical protein
VLQILASPSSNHGLVVGSLTGGRNGVFELKRGRFAGSTDAKIIYSLSAH